MNEKTAMTELKRSVRQSAQPGMAEFVIHVWCMALIASITSAPLVPKAEIPDF